MAAAPLEIRCFCSRTPLLAVAGRNQRTNEPYVHIKVFKQGRIFGEVVVTEGVVRLRCRECLRWHKVRIRHVGVDSKPEELPDGVKL